MLFLRGTRDYVQGTQLIARAAECLSGQAAKNGTLIEAKFAKITQNIVHLQTEPDADAIGVVQFRTDENTVHVYLIDTDRPAPRKDIAMPVTAERSAESGESPVIYTFAGASEFEDVLNAFVMAIKAEHVHRFPGAKDIWFTGLRSGTLPLTPRASTGRISLSLMRQLEGQPTHQTLWRCALEADDGTSVATCAITFSFVPGADA